MAQISASAVKSLRDRTKLPMMKCKEALTKTGGDEEAAVELLRKEGTKFTESRGDRETSAGRIEVYASVDGGLGAMIELQCESAPVAGSAQFKTLSENLVKQLAGGPGAGSPDELLGQASPSGSGSTLGEELSDLTNQIREVFKLARVLRIDSPCGAYRHHDGSTGVLVQVEGGNEELAKEIGMQVVAMRPQVVAVEDLDPALVEKEREILSEAARTEGKPENIIEKMIEGRLRTNFYAQRVLNEQPFIKDDKQTVGKVCKAAGMKVVRFEHWELGGA